MANATDIAYMQRALSLARRGSGNTSPNPMVGAVIVKSGQVVAEGYHRRAGADHAEIVALKKARRKAKGATLYVSLEPCCHRGRTGPCTEAIIAAGVARVVFAVKDPNPMVNGRGAARLRRAGVVVTGGVLRKEASELNEAYFSGIRNNRPFITLKTAQTVDGRIATVTGDSQWISGPQSQKFAHRLRAETDAVLVGGGTVRADNPSLTVRAVKGRNPYRVIVSNSLKLPAQCRLIDDNADGRTIIAASEPAIERFTRRRRPNPLIFWCLKATRDGLVDLNDLVAKARDFGLISLLVEGGGRLATSFLKAGLADKYIAIIAPKVLGSGIEAVGDLRIRRLAEAVEFERQRFEPSGDDMIFVGYPKRSA